MMMYGRKTTVRPVGEADLDLLAGWFGDAAFVEHWGGTPVSPAEVAEKYVGRRRPEVESFVVLAGGEPVGYAQYWEGTCGPSGRGRRRVSGWCPGTAISCSWSAILGCLRGCELRFPFTVLKIKTKEESTTSLRGGLRRPA